MNATGLDGISRELGEGSTRRGLLRLLSGLTAVTAAGVIGAGGLSETAMAKRRGRRRGKRKTNGQLRPDQQEVLEAAATSIPPNCIYVCCDGTCDSWKMCLRCVKWPKGTTTAGATTIAG